MLHFGAPGGFRWAWHSDYGDEVGIGSIEAAAEGAPVDNYEYVWQVA